MAKKEKIPKEKKPKKIKEKKEKVKKPKADKRQSLLSKPDGDDSAGESSPPQKGKKKLLIIAGIILIILLLAAGGAFFLVQSGILDGFFNFGAEEATVDKPQIYTDGLAYYQSGSYYDAKAAFGYLEGYQDSREMAEKINLDTVYSSNGAKISEYIGSDVVNNYLLSYQNYSDINTALTGASGSGSSSGSSSSSSGETSSSSESSSSGESEKKKDEKVEYDESVKETVKEKTTELIDAASPVKYLEMSEGNILYSANESLKKSAEYSVEAAKKIREGVDKGTYKPGGTSETDTEIKTLLDNMKAENDKFLTQIDTIIGANGLAMLGYTNAGNCMKRYSQTIVVFY